MPRPLSVKHILLPLGSLFLASALFLAPQEAENVQNAGELSEEQARIELALLYIQSSETPMKGILMLRGLRDVYPENSDIVWHLGNFAFQTRQYEKAGEYFETFIEMAPVEDTVRKNAGMILLSDTYAAQGDHPKAIDLLVDARKSLRDTVLLNAIQERLSNYLK